MSSRIFFLLTLALSSAALAQPTTAPTAIITDPPRDTFLLVPLHVHVLSCDTRPDLTGHLTDDDIHRIIIKSNNIWHKAGIHLALARVLREPVARLTEFELEAEKDSDFSFRSPYRLLAPQDSHQLPGLHVYYLHEFPPNGVYLGNRTCFVKDSAHLKPVAGGIDEPIPRVTAHELGHAMGLRHRQDTFNLMASGTTGTGLSAAEVETARNHAKDISGVMTVAEAEKALSDATAAKDVSRAQMFRTALDQLPK